MSFGKVNLYAFLLIIPITIVLLVPFILIWDYEIFESGRESFMDFFIPLIVGGIIIHELLHGVTWGIFAPKGMKSIKFGFKWKYLTPYCHCKEALRVKHYKIGSAMPLIVLGILPSIFAIIIGNGAILSFGIFFVWAASGDIIALFMLRKLDSDSYIFDHPDKMGFYKEINLE